MQNETVLVLRVCKADLKSYAAEANGFQWPASGHVSAPDWRPDPICGYGLHGFVWGEGDVKGAGADWAFGSEGENAKWLVVEVVKTDLVVLDGKVKFPRGEVVFVGSLVDAAKLIATRAPAGTSIIGGTATAGECGTATAGYRGTATAGECGLLMIAYYDPKRSKYRVAVAEVGENGIEPNTAYVLDGDHKFVKKG